MDSSFKNNLNAANTNLIKHVGYVSKISDNYVEISLEGNLNCSACNAKAACGVSDTDKKIVEIYNNTQKVSIDERVTVVMQNSLGLKAVFFGYVFPFILLFSVLIIASLFVKEWLAGLLALAVLVPYYLLLYYNQSSLRKLFTVSILKTN